MPTQRESYVIVAAPTFVFGVAMEGWYAERHRITARTTRYPVETGADLTDHVVREPYELKLKGAATAQTLGQNAGVSRWGGIINHLNRRRPVTIITHLGTYRNMMLVGGMAEVDQNTERSLDVDLEFREILRAHVTRDAGSAAAAGGTPTTGPAVDRSAEARRGRVNTIAFEQFPDAYLRRADANAPTSIVMQLSGPPPDAVDVSGQ